MTYLTEADRETAPADPVKVIGVGLTPAQAWHLARFLQRVPFDAYAQNNDEAIALREAAQQLVVALRGAGYRPR